MKAEEQKVLMTLTPSESKRLIAKGVMNLEEVRRALKRGTIIIGLGTTNAYVAEEILDALHDTEARTIDKQRYAAGVITARGTCIVPKEEREKDVIIRDGKPCDMDIEKAVEELTAEDVFIKGANALDASGTAGILLAHPAGGTIGAALGTIMARGVNFIIPVGIEKTIPYSIRDAARQVGKERFYKSLGRTVGLIAVHGKVVTEVEALKLLGARNAFPIGAGGVDGGEGSVVLCAEGSTQQMDDLMEVITHLKGESALKVVKADCEG